MNLKIKNLSRSYPQGKTIVKALDGVSFDVLTGESLAIIGPSGSGKTTLLTLLAGLDSPTSGEIWLNEQPIHQLSEEDLTQFRAHNIGIVFQQFHLMPHLSALENVCLPLELLGEDRVVERALHRLDQVGLKERAHHLPSQLSGGEKQRVAIARASVTSPKYLLADEPSGNLDTETGKKVMDLLFELSKAEGIQLILITHDQQLAGRCQNQIELVGGHLK